MPQFDKITFFNQVFWLFFFFSGFYLILLTTFLPRISSVLKVRIKKLQKGTEGILLFSKEQDTVTNLFNLFLEKLSILSKIFLFVTVFSEFFGLETDYTTLRLKYDSWDAHFFMEKSLRQQSVLVLVTRNEKLI